MEQQRRVVKDRDNRDKDGWGVAAGTKPQMVTRWEKRLPCLTALLRQYDQETSRAVFDIKQKLGDSDDFLSCWAFQANSVS